MEQTPSHTLFAREYVMQMSTGISNVPQDLRALIDRIDVGQGEPNRPAAKRAVFDLDGTLVIGDMGEAVYAMILSEGRSLRMSWAEYVQERNTRPQSAYVKLVEAMTGLTIEEVIHATYRVMTRTKRSIIVEGSEIRVPSPHPVMRGLVQLLHRKGFAVHVITASSQVVARVVCEEWFGIPEERVFGLWQGKTGQQLNQDIKSPMPIGEGKTDVYRLFVGTDAPVITGSDSMLDLPLLDLTMEGGIVLWLGRPERREIVEMSIAQPVLTYPVFPSSRLQLPPSEFAVLRARDKIHRARVRMEPEG